MSDSLNGQANDCHVTRLTSSIRRRKTSESDGDVSQVVEKIVRFLERRYPIKTAAAVGASIEFSPDAFDKWKLTGSLSFRAFWRLLELHQLDLLAELPSEPWPWLDRARIAAEHERLEELRQRTERRLAEIDQLIGKQFRFPSPDLREE